MYCMTSIAIDLFLVHFIENGNIGAMKNAKKKKLSIKQITEVCFTKKILFQFFYCKNVIQCVTGHFFV